MSCKIIAHRGSNKKAPQNTLPAFIKAIEDHADGFETDVHLTRDGVPIICHNYSIDEMSDGVGDINSYTLAELKQFDFGSGFSDDYKGTAIPTLAQFLEVTAKSSAEIINIELKCPQSGIRELVQKTLNETDRFSISDRVLISSFSPSVLKTVKDINQNYKTAFLYPTYLPSVCRPVLFNPFSIAKNAGCDYIHPSALLVTPLLVETAHKKGIKVNAWTVNGEKMVKRLLKYGVDGIITDCPDKVRGYIDDFEKENFYASKKENINL